MIFRLRSIAPGNGTQLPETLIPHRHAQDGSTTTIHMNFAFGFSGALGLCDETIRRVRSVLRLLSVPARLGENFAHRANL
jgi:hypothetical protein